MRAFTSGLNAAKITVYNKNVSNESCSELNLQQKKLKGVYVYVPQEWSGTRRLQRFAFLKYYSVLQ